MRTSTIRGFASAIAASLLAVAACDQTKATPERTCRGTFAISAENIGGASLPPKTLVLTFDDGPGLRTAELSAYLGSRGIHATFFVNGMFLGEGTGILQQMVADGHAVANHTQHHRSLTGVATTTPRPTDADVVSELEQTDAIIAPFTGGHFFFRAPFGDFDAIAAAAVEASPMKKYIGPVTWEIGDRMGPAQAADWDCWKPGADNVVMTPQQCGDLYLAQIEAVGRGIVLLHDPYFINDDPAQGGTVDMVKLIVPVLEAKGYTFARLEDVPAIAALLPAKPPAAVDAGDAPEAGTASGVDAGEPAARVLTPVDAGSAADAGADPCAPSSMR